MLPAFAGVTGGQQAVQRSMLSAELQPNIATQNTDLSRTNLLNDLDANVQVTPPKS